MSDTGVRIRFSPIRGRTPHAVLAQALYVPALLGEFKLDEEAGHTDYETIADGEFSVPRGGAERDNRMLRVSDLEMLTLYWPARWLHPSQQNPDWVERKLYMIHRSRRPVEMLVRLHQLGWDDVILRAAVTFRSLSQIIKKGEADTKYWTLAVKEWRPTGEVRREHVGPGGKALPTTHRIAAGDTLERLSKRYYGSFAGWRAIAQENGLTKWGQKTPLVQHKRFKVGSKIKIPRKPPIAFARPPRSRARGHGGAEAA